MVQEYLHHHRWILFHLDQLNHNYIDMKHFLPIFFDDNIHNDAEDSIVAVRRKRLNANGKEAATSGYEAMNGEETLAEQGVHLVRVPTLEPILNPNWFLQQIDLCEAAWATRLATME